MKRTTYKGWAIHITRAPSGGGVRCVSARHPFLGTLRAVVGKDERVAVEAMRRDIDALAGLHRF